MKLFLFVTFFLLINLTYAVREVGESSSRSIDLNKDLIELQNSNEESSSSPIDLNEDLSKLQDSDCSCRLGSSIRIINGKEAEPHLVPWQVSLANSTGYHFCGAIIINHYYVLTSANCLKDKSKEEIKVRVGLHNINDPIPSEKTYDVELKDGFNFNKKYGGMAMLKLKNYIEFIRGEVEPACLNLVIGEILTKSMVSGWGHTSEKIENTGKNFINYGTLSPVLKIGYLNEVGHNINERYIFTSSLYGDSPSIADNGGPLHSTRDGLTMVEGVLLDFLDESGTIKHYFNGNSVFARLSFYKEWIITKTGEDYCTKDRFLKSESKRKIESSSSQIDLNEDLSKLQHSDCSCRLRSRKRIINGKEAEPHLVPWQVSLANSTGYHFCGAIIINHYNILTSANCLKDKSKEEIKVRVGLHNINDPIPSEKTYDVQLIDGFNFKRKHGGMAMLKLTHSIKFITGEVEPACLDLVKGEVLRILMVSGWGHTSPKIQNTETNLVTFGKLSPVLKIGYLYETRKSCNIYNICTNSFNGDSPYIADNGGPLHYTREGITMVEGVFLGLRDEPGTIKIFGTGNIFFSRLSFFKEWLLEKFGGDYCTKDEISNIESKSVSKSKSRRKIESSSLPISLNQKLSKLQDFNEESSSSPICIDQDLIKLQDADCSCRLGSSKRIINGKEAEPHLVPWQVSLANSTGYHFCGAIIINHYYILTSAKCLKDKSEEEIKVRVGLHNINDPIPSEKTYDVQLIDGFNFKRKHGGMAMLKLTHSIKFITGEVEPACLDLAKGEVLRILMVSGWGHTSPKIQNTETNLVTFGKLSPVLKIGYLYETRKSCNIYNICTKSLNGDSPYIADNGGPLHYTRKGITMVEGVFLDLLGESRTVEIFRNGNIIFSRLSFFKEWFLEKIGADYCTKDEISNIESKSESKRKIESSSRSIDLNKDLIELQNFNEESSSPIDLNEDLSKLQDSDCSCRLRSSKRIINGKEADPHLVPWQVSLANSTGYHFCGGIIINHYNILTSANCLKDKSEEEIKVRVGIHNINDPIPSEKTYDVELIDGFNFKRKRGGMAKLKLKHSIKFITGEVEPACLDLVKVEVLRKLMVSGWGHTSPKIQNTETNLVTFGTLSPVLKIGYLYEIRKSCNIHYICTKSLNGDSPYIADNGGPLHYTKEGITMVEGVFLDLRDEPGTIKIFRNGYIIFSRFSFYKEWFVEKIGEDYCTEDRVLKSGTKRKIDSYDSFDDPKGKKKLRFD